MSFNGLSFAKGSTLQPHHPRSTEGVVNSTFALDLMSDRAAKAAPHRMGIQQSGARMPPGLPAMQGKL